MKTSVVPSNAITKKDLPGVPVEMVMCLSLIPRAVEVRITHLKYLNFIFPDHIICVCTITQTNNLSVHLKLEYIVV